MTKQEIWLRLMQAAIPASAMGVVVKNWETKPPPFECNVSKIAANIADNGLQQYLKRFPNQAIGKATRAIAIGDTVYSADIEE